MTPMLKQYYDLKKQCEDFVLFFRMGDFYELFGEDASLVAPKLQIVLTSRDYGSTEKIPFCGVPHHSAKIYWIKLLKQGYKIAIADQVENPSEAKGLVRREITKYMTPGCIEDIEGLDANTNNYIACVIEDPKSKHWSIVHAELTTGEILYASYDDLSSAIAQLLVIQPSELLVRSFMREKISNIIQEQNLPIKPMITLLSESDFRDQKSIEEIIGKCFGNIPNIESKDKELILQTTGILLLYIKQLHFSLERFTKLKAAHLSDEMDLNPNTIKDLEIFYSLRRQNTDCTLYKEINHCLTPMGQRLLQQWLARPLANKNLILQRQNYVAWFVENRKVLIDCRNCLKKCSDLKRLTTKIINQQISPYEFGLIYQSLLSIRQLINSEFKNIGTLAEDFHTILSECDELLVLLNRSLVSCHADSSFESSQTQQNIFLSSYDPKLTELKHIARNSENAISAYETKLKEQTNINNLKIKAHKSFGLLIEITKTHLSKVPNYFIRKQTMINCERFTTPELQELDTVVSTAMTQAEEREHQLYQDLIQACGYFKNSLHKTADLMAQLDIFQSFAHKAVESKFVRPKINSKQILNLKNSRHPVVESQMGRHAYASNDIELTPEKSTILLTGPNMAGKSTLMRQTALSAILNQIGSFIPAAEANLPIFDQIFTRIGASDDLAKGQSTFMVEMLESANIARQATHKSLVIIDEVGRGTSTEDGIAIASAILEHVSTKNKPLCIFATHFHELVPFAKKLPNVICYQTEALTEGHEIKFSHRLIPGVCKSSFGIEVAKMAGMPESIIQQAKQLLGNHLLEKEAPKEQTNKTQNNNTQHSNSDLEQQICSKIAQLRLNRLTPIGALNTLFELQNMLSSGEETELFLGH